MKKNVSSELHKSKGSFRKYSFDIYKVDEIFYHLLEEKVIILDNEVKLPSLDEIKDKKYCKWHNT